MAKRKKPAVLLLAKERKRNVKATRIAGADVQAGDFVSIDSGDGKVYPALLERPPLSSSQIAERVKREQEKMLLFASRYGHQPTAETDMLQVRRAVQYDAAVSAARELFLRKNREYGDAISKNGVLGAVAELCGIAGRLNKVMYHDLPTCAEEAMSSKLLPRAERDEILRDKFIDAINYGVIGLIMMEDGNFTGK